MKLDEEIAQNDPTIAVLSMDKQQNLPSPQSNLGPAFFKRKLKTNHWMVVDINDNAGYGFVWPGNVASAEGDEIETCLRH